MRMQQRIGMRCKHQTLMPERLFDLSYDMHACMHSDVLKCTVLNNIVLHTSAHNCTSSWQTCGLVSCTMYCMHVLSLSLQANHATMQPTGASLTMGFQI